MFTSVSLFDNMGREWAWPMALFSRSFTVVEMKINIMFLALAFIHHLQALQHLRGLLHLLPNSNCFF